MVPSTSAARLAALGLLVSGLAAACMTPPEAPVGQPVTQEPVSITVSSVELARPDLEGPEGGVPTDAPLLVVSLSVHNADPAAAQRYDVSFGTSQATQAEAALLFANPPAEGGPTAGTPVPRVQLGALRYLADPVTEPQFVPAGGTIEDKILFQAPPAGTTELVLSLPPSAFGVAAKMPAYVRIPWSAPDAVPGPPVGTLGEAYAAGAFSFTVDSATVQWVRLASGAESTQGYSDGPLVRVDFTVENTGDSTIEYIPAEASNRYHPPILLTGDGQPVPRATFSPGVRALDKRTERQQIGAGERYQNFLLFQRPPEGTTALRLVVPGARFGGTGLVRVDLPFTWSDPAQPAELTPRVIEAPAE
jgi:hypothetical protein